MRNLQLFFKKYPDKAKEFHEKGKAFNSDYAYLEKHNLQRQEDGQAMDFTNYWSVLKDSFGRLKPEEDAHCRCAICEKELNDLYATDIEHYRPKGSKYEPNDGYWWLAYEYTNYYLSCSECNRSYKNEAFPLDIDSPKATYTNGISIEDEKPLLVNPMYDNPNDFFEIVIIPDPQAPTQKKAVILMPKKEVKGYTLRKAEKTIELFNLDLRYGEYLKDQSGKSHYEFLRTRTDKNRKNLFADFYRKLFTLFTLYQQQDFIGIKSYLQGEGKENGITSLGLTHLIVSGQWSQVL